MDLESSEFGIVLVVRDKRDTGDRLIAPAASKD